MSVRDWYVPLSDGSPVRLFAFPHAGAGYARFTPFARVLAPDVALWGANLPGRQARLDEPTPTDLTALVDELAERLIALSPERYGLFGYCGGGLLAFLVARALRDRGVRLPSALIVASFEAPDIAWRPTGIAGLPSDRLWARLIRDGGVAPELAAEERLRQTVEPAVRADFGMVAGYRHAPAPPLPIPVTVCFGDGDRTPRGSWLGWRRHSTYAPRLRSLRGGHWLLDDAVDELAAVVVDALDAPEGAPAPERAPVREGAAP